jgi:hypothetical protein
VSGYRYRLVIHQLGENPVVSGTLLKPSEIAGTLDIEERLHRGAGWHVTRYGAIVRAARGKVVRWIWVRCRTPQEDKL